MKAKAGVLSLALFWLTTGFSQEPVPDLDQVSPAPSNQEADEIELDLFARDTYRIDTIICPFKGDIDYDPGDIECSLLEVPENRENPDSRFIELHVVKLNSRWGKEEETDSEKEDTGLAPGKRDDPVVYLTGGPGAPATYYVNRFKDHTLLDHRDLYILEQRGIGYSDDFCTFYDIRKPADGDVATYAESLRVSHIDKTDCAVNARAAGVDVLGYNTLENARDVKALRRALGFEQWNVWGISYGSVLGQAYIKEDPDGILAVALDAIMPLSVHGAELHWRVIQWFDRDLKILQELCNQQPACAEYYPDLGGRLRQAVATVIDRPIEVEVKDTEAYPSGKARFFQDIAALLPFTLLYEQDNYPGLPGLIYAWADAIERRDENLFKALAGGGGGGFGNSSAGMRNAIICIDGHQEAQGRANNQDRLDFPILGQLLGGPEFQQQTLALCAELGMPMRPAEEYEPVQTDLPALIIEGHMDPVTPPPNAKAILPGFTNGTYVEFPYAGHGPSRSVKCAGHMLNGFFDNPAADPDLSCVDQMEAPQFYAPLYTTGVGPRLAAMYLDDKKAVLGPALWAGVPTLILLLGFVILTLAPIGRLIDGRRATPTGGARGMAWLSTLLGLGALGVLGTAAAVTGKKSELLLVFGMIPWASYGAWLGVAAGLAGLVTLVMTLRARRGESLQIGTLLGLLLTGLSAVALSAFLLVFGLGPF
ncbi:MAG: alpha/beta fold hydrolase [Xanthomonadales bacterium]|nr:alpha/beta fold hydrolase [Xanthomonadales bacterium]